MSRPLTTPQNKLFNATGSVSCEKEALPELEDVSPPLSQPEKLKIKSKPSSGFGCHPAQRLAGSTAPTFHDFRTFPKLRQLQGEEKKEKPLVKRSGAADMGSEHLGSTPGRQGLRDGAPPPCRLTATAGHTGGLPEFRELEAAWSGFSSTPSLAKETKAWKRKVKGPESSTAGSILAAYQDSSPTSLLPKPQI